MLMHDSLSTASFDAPLMKLSANLMRLHNQNLNLNIPDDDIPSSNEQTEEEVQLEN